ncbi:response regulator [Pontibacter diazotrophicus]|uniref:Response regulator n=2 Tax=Pontibacter diazotrophicus TaxID=1400979 RepID=A0A3D8LBA0_9BACT|nr:response regulator [Pontibacter diazotrophicus]
MVTKPEKWQQINVVLVVDDDDNWCFVSKKILQKAGVGKDIITANNGQQALEILQAFAAEGKKLPELIFLDIKMPLMDGFQFLEIATKSAELDLSRTKIFVCSSSFLSKDKDRAKQYPVAGFITKPLTLEILRDILPSD